jgi:alcohol dehydrogenase
MRVRGAVVWEAGLPAPYAESRPVDVLELELADPGPGELLVRVGAAGLCHSDLSVIDGSRVRELPIALGHECAGEVVGLGAGVSGFSEGDHVILAFVPPCGDCGPCTSGRAALCEPAAVAGVSGTLLSGERRVSVDRTSLAHHSGVSAFAEHIVVDARSAVVVDRDLPWELAAVFGCAVLTGVGAAVNAAAVQPGDRVAVWGLGGVGLSAVMGAVMAGASSVIAVDLVGHKVDRAVEVGAVGVPGGPDAVEAVRSLTDGGADKVIDASGKIDALTEAYAATRRGGLTVTVGLPHPSKALAVPATAMVLEERTVRGSYMGSGVPSRDIPRYVAAYREGRLPVDRLLTGTLPLDDINEGFDRLASGEAVRQAVVF